LDSEFATMLPIGLAADLVVKWLPVRVDERTVSETKSAAPDDGSRTITVVASTESEDRIGDVILASGWELNGYLANPVILWAHDYFRPAIGRAEKVWVEDASLKAELIFADTPFARDIQSLYEQGFMRGISVGFRAIESESRTTAAGGKATLFKRQELLEISVAPVPLNRDALAISSPTQPDASASRGAVNELWEDAAIL
jgi:HK97 family phage prohead protease